MVIDVGTWMKKNGNAIYACTDALFEKQDWGYYTKSMKEPNKINMVVFNMPLTRVLKVLITDKKIKIKKINLLNHTDTLPYDVDDNYKGREYLITLTKELKIDEPFVIVMETESL